MKKNRYIFRNEINITQLKLAEKPGVSLVVIRKIEQGKTNINKVNQVMIIFGNTLVCTYMKDEGIK